MKSLFSLSQGAAANPENEDQQQRLREAAEGLRVATNAAAQNAIKKKIVNRLEVCIEADARFTWQRGVCLINQIKTKPMDRKLNPN